MCEQTKNFEFGAAAVNVSDGYIVAYCHTLVPYTSTAYITDTIECSQTATDLTVAQGYDDVATPAQTEQCDTECGALDESTAACFLTCYKARNSKGICRFTRVV